MSAKPQEQKISERVLIINAVKTYLGFFVLVVLVIEATLGVLALKSSGHIQVAAVYGMIIIIMALILIVSFFAYRKPDALFRSMVGQQQLQEFSRAIQGHWWERIRPEEPTALSFAEITPDAATSTVRMSGKGFGRDGEVSAIWETVSTCINPAEKKVFYYWKGWHPSKPGEPYEGFGEIAFHESEKGIVNGVGFFSDTNLTDLKSTTMKSIEFYRSTVDETQLMMENDSELISGLIRKKLD
jgi:hypothetical protein